jgi:predicted regulator of Ras-like GTPase activity (Roadblock/LC7/MglB family)
MKNQLWDSFNFSETSELFNILKKEIVSNIEKDDEKEEQLISYKMFDDITGSEPNIKSEITTDNNDSETEKNETNYNFQTDLADNNENGDTLERALSGMCRRGGFKGAVIADRDGLPIAVYNSPVNDEILAAYSTILGESLEKAATFLNQPDANNISLDINIIDKIVLRKFNINRNTYYVMIILAQNIDERAEVEILISQIRNFYQD